MKDVLLIYRSGIAIDEFKFSFDKYKKDNITVIVENKVTRNLMVYFYPKVRFITLNEFFKGKLDNMKFDYIVGNPPYQYPKEVATNKKLYIDITLKMLSLVKKDGIIDFVVPKAILYQRNKEIKKALQKKMFYVDFSTDLDFNVGQTIINFKLKEKCDNDITVIRKDKSTIIVQDLNEVADIDEILIIKILNKVDCKINYKAKLQIYQTNKLVPQNSIHTEKSITHNVPIMCSRKKYKDSIGYTDKMYYKEKRLVIPFGRGWEDGCRITDIQTDSFFFSSRGIKNDKQLRNMKKYLESKLISYCVVNYSTKIKIDGYYNFLTKIPDIDLDRSYTDEELYKEFNITDEEQKEIERWYKEWI